MKANGKTEAAVLAVLDKFMETYQKRDIEGLMGLFAPDDDQVMFGTGADEKRVGLKEIQKQVERDWAQTDEIAMEFDTISVSGADSFAWAAADGCFKARVNGQTMSMPARLTCVFEKRNGDWLMVQSHFSTPAASQDEGDSLPS